MSAYIVDRQDIDLLVRAALHAYPAGRPGTTNRISWWRTDETGDYAGWRELDPSAEHRSDDEYKAFYTPSQLGQILVDENVASVSHRYPDDDVDAGELPGPTDAYYLGPYVYADPGRDLSPGEVFATIDCLDYQSCEHDGWRRSEAYAFLAYKKPTMTGKGGNTDELYAGDGRLEMARSLERRWPGVVKVRRRYGRPQHVVDWKKFDTSLIRKPDVDLSTIKPNEYGLVLR